MGLINKGAHLTPEGVTDILRYQGAMNKGLSQILKISFPNVVLAERPLVDNLDSIDPNWFSGFVDGEGVLFYWYN